MNNVDKYLEKRKNMAIEIFAYAWAFFIVLSIIIFQNDSVIFCLIEILIGLLILKRIYDLGGLDLNTVVVDEDVENHNVLKYENPIFLKEE